MAPTAPRIIYGAAGIANFTNEAALEIFSILKKHNVNDLDTAYLYINSEKTLGEMSAHKDFIIHTKASGFGPGGLTEEKVLAGMQTSLKLLQVNSVETYFLHGPDYETPISETLKAINTLYEAGHFKHFGLSNFTPEDVKKVYDLQVANKGVLPTVFQGSYNPLSRHYEMGLFSLLRELNIAFYAYSPIAGGFLVKSPESLKAGKADGRLAKDTFLGDMYIALYSKTSLIEALEEWESIAKEAGCSKAALAYRWVAWNSFLNAANGDGIIVGASKPVQLEESLTAIEDGPLDERIVKKIDAIWKKVEHEAPLDNYHSYAALKSALN